MASRDPKAKPIPLPELIKLFKQLDHLKGAEKAALARRLSSTDGPTLVTLSAEGDKGMWQAKQEPGVTYEQLKTQLGYRSISAVSDAVGRHRRRMRGDL